MKQHVSWDDGKNRLNRALHGVSLEDVSALFTNRDDFLEIFDTDHSDDEDRFIAIGPISRGLVLVVWTEGDSGSIRLISARWATKREQVLYHEYMETKS
jgi:uncharacterized DUF497 family protein